MGCCALRFCLTLCRSLVIDGFLKNLKPVESSPVLFCYCKSCQPPEQVLRNILRHLVHLNPKAKAAAEVRTRVTPPSGEESCKLIKTLIGNLQSATVIIEALDNCAGLNGSDSYTYNDLLSALLKIMNTSPCRIKVLVSNRENDKIKKALTLLKDLKTVAQLGLSSARQISPHSISTDQQPHDDITMFIKDTVDKWKPTDFLPSEDNERAQMKNHVIKTVKEKAGVMYESHFTSSFSSLLSNSFHRTLGSFGCSTPQTDFATTGWRMISARTFNLRRYQVLSMTCITRATKLSPSPKAQVEHWLSRRLSFCFVRRRNCP